MIAAQQIYLATRSEPFAQIDGLRSDGNAYVLLDSPKSIDNNIDMILEVSIPANFELEGGVPFAGVVRGSPSSYNARTFLMQWGGKAHGHISGGYVPAYYGFVSNWMSCFRPFQNYPYGTKVKCRLQAKSGMATVSGSVNGVVVQSSSQSYSSNVFSSPIGIFSVPYCTTDGVMLGMVASPATCCVVHSFELYVDDVKRYRLVPVRKGADACFLNEVTGDFVMNSGTGDFLGIDV